MKSKLIVIFAIAVQLLWSPAACPSGLDELSYTFKFPAPVITRAGEYDTVTMAGCEPWHVTGQPIVPFKGRAVLIPEGREIAGIRFETGEKITLPGRYYLEPAGPPFPLSRPDLRRDATPNPETYASSLPYPSQVLSGENLQQKSGYSILFFNLFPVSYLPFPRELSYCRSIRIIITLKAQPRKRAAGLTTVRDVAADREAVAALVINPDITQSYRAPARRSGVDPLDSYSQVIITGSALESSFETLRDHRINRGLTSTIVTIEDIVADPDYRWYGTFGDDVSWADDTAARIRNFIRDAYQNWETEYVLLGGDYSVVPFRLFWVVAEDPDPGGPYITEMPSDNYYGCLDGSYNYNGNSRWGEETDGPGGGDVDLTFEVHVGRFGVTTAEQVTNLTAKIIAYEESNSGILKEVLMAGEHLGFGGESEYAKPSMEEIRLGSSAHSYTTQGFADNSWFETSDTLYDRDGTWSNSTLIGRINSGIAITNHLGHANKTYCMKLYISDFSSFTNTDYFFGYSQGCNPGQFDTGGSWCEEITRNQHGAFAFIGNVRYGFGLSESTDGPSQKFHRPFWHGLIAEGIKEVGRLNSYSKEYNITRINEPVSRWIYYEVTLFGDPATRLHDGSISPTPTPTAKPSSTPTPGPSPAVPATPTLTPKMTPSPSTTPTPIPTSTPAQTPYATGTATPTITPAQSSTPVPPKPGHYVFADGDYNGDGSADIAIYRPEAGLWAIRGLSRAYFGIEDDIPVPGDYRGDGTTAIAIFRPEIALWAVRGLTTLYFGAGGNRPVPGDYDGDGTCDRGVFREADGLWAINGLTRIHFGAAGDLPIPGDYQGDGTIGIGLFRPVSGLWALQGISRAYFGRAGDRPIPADYDGNGEWEIGIFRPASGLWAIQGITRTYFGNSQDRPVPGDYTGTGSDSIGIFRPSTGLWALREVTRAYFGTTGDIPATR